MVNYDSERVVQMTLINIDWMDSPNFKLTTNGWVYNDNADKTLIEQYKNYSSSMTAIYGKFWWQK